MHTKNQRSAELKHMHHTVVSLIDLPSVHSLLQLSQDVLIELIDRLNVEKDELNSWLRYCLLVLYIKLSHQLKEIHCYALDTLHIAAAKDKIMQKCLDYKLYINACTHVHTYKQ